MSYKLPLEAVYKAFELFPAVTKGEMLIWRLRELEAQLKELFPASLSASFSQSTNAQVTKAIEESNVIIGELNDFKRERIESAIRLQLDIRQIIATLYKVKEHSKRVDEGKIVRVRDESMLAARMADDTKIGAEDFTVEELLRIQEYSRGMLIYECVMHSAAKIILLEFAVKFSFQWPELSQCVPTDLDHKMQIGYPQLTEAESELQAFVTKTSVAEAEKKAKAGNSSQPLRTTNKAVSGQEFEEGLKALALTKQNRPIQTCFSCGKQGHVDKYCTELDSLISHSPPTVPAKPSCYNCGMYGHDAAHCTTQYSDPEPDKCDYCGKEGHDEYNCFTRFPELRKKFEEAQERKIKRRWCQECGDFSRPRCHSLHGRK